MSREWRRVLSQNDDGNNGYGSSGESEGEFREDLREWVHTDRKIALRVLDLVEAILRDPFTGIGKP